MLSLYHKPKQHLVGVDVGSTKVSLIELSRQNQQYRVERYATAILPDHHPNDTHILDSTVIGTALQHVLELAQPNTLLAAIAVPSTMVTQKVIVMDRDMSDEEREIQIRMDAEEYLPFSLQDASFDFEVLCVCPENPDQVDVLFVATRTEHVNARVDLVEAVGLTAKVVEVENHAMERVFQLILDISPQPTQCFGILQVNRHDLTLSALQANSMIYHRTHRINEQETHHSTEHPVLSFKDSLSASTQAITWTDDTMSNTSSRLNHIVQQCEYALHFFFSSTQLNELTHLYLAGEYTNLTGLSSQLQQKGYPVTVINPFKNMQFSSAINIEQIKKDAPSLMIACGLALRSFEA